MKIYRYVIDHDMGFSPNPFYGVCTLANCKPVIRRVAKTGDFILGFGSANSAVSGKLIYWMLVEETTNFDQYWKDPRFQRKKPVVNGSLIKFYGDNIYHRDDHGAIVQEWSFHSLPDGRPNPRNIKRDTGSTSRILVGSDFGYYGRAAITVPEEISPVIARGRGHRTKLRGCSPEDVAHWLLHSTERGFCGEPLGWSRISA